MTQKKGGPVLGLHPSSRGFGWILFESVESPFDWGAADIHVGGNGEALRRVIGLFRKYRPAVLAIEAFEDEESRRSPRVRALYRRIVREAERRRIAVRIFSRNELSRVLSGAQTRQQIAIAVARRFPVLRHRLPKPRRIWDSERSTMAIFCAAACAIACFADTHDGP